MKVLEDRSGANPSTDIAASGPPTRRIKRSFSVVVPLILISALFTCCLTGCKATSIVAKRNPTAVHPVSRLYVMVYTKGLNNTHFAELIIKDFRVALTNWPVAVEASEATVVEMDERGQFEKARDFQADALLILQPAGGIFSEYGSYETIMYDASLFTSQGSTCVWRAHIENNGARVLMSQRMRELVDCIIDQLEKDGFLSKDRKTPKPLEKDSFV